ncbi:MAG: hypothetical protein M1133_04325 [Armatimonadetes bacterium]|nr:hypothetical protein [Armatimonadota bacterium]
MASITLKQVMEQTRDLVMYYRRVVLLVGSTPGECYGVTLAVAHKVAVDELAAIVRIDTHLGLLGH